MTLNAVELSRRLLDDPDLAAELETVDPFAIQGQPVRVAFWLNVYNARLRHELRERPRSGSVLRHRGLFRHCDYRVGEHDYSLDVIEHGLLRLNARPPYSPRRLLRASDPRLLAAPPELDPRIHFALNCGAQSCPLVRAYGADDVDAQLDLATGAYFDAEAHLERGGKRVVLPALCKLYRADFGDRAGLVAFAERHLGQPLAGRRIRFASFDWTLVPQA